MSATRLSVILIASLAVLLAVLVAGSGFVASGLLKRSAEATHAQIDASVSADDPSRLEDLKAYLAKNTTGIAQTKALTENLGAYDQNRIVATINGYAKTAGVTVTGYDFAATPAAGAGATATTAAPGTFNLSLSPSLKYANFIVFLRLLEQGLMPATVTTATVSADSQVPGNVSVSSLTIKVAS